MLSSLLQDKLLGCVERLDTVGLRLSPCLFFYLFRGFIEVRYARSVLQSGYFDLPYQHTIMYNIISAGDTEY